MISPDSWFARRLFWVISFQDVNKYLCIISGSLGFLKIISHSGPLRQAVKLYKKMQILREKDEENKIKRKEKEIEHVRSYFWFS
jgi:hypothetical protein